ncbi:MAG TPA: Gldg family protein [Polyangiaceae bacterium]|nr:Gldg family protein [Polyangiaceae bacterium]
MATKEHRRRAAAQTGLYLIVISGIVIFINLLSAGAYMRIDTTKNERYTLSKGSGALVQSLKGPLTVDAYVNTKLPKLKVFVQELTDLLKSYETAGAGKFKYTLIEPETDELRKQAEEAGLQPMAMGDPGEGGGDQIAIAQGYLGLVFKYGSEKETIPQLSPQNSTGLEFWISNKIRELRDKADNIKHRIGVVVEKDELKLTDTNLLPRQGGGGGPSFKSVLSQAFPFYELVDVNLGDGNNEIDKGLDGLIITQPGKAYTEKELRRIDQFLMLGNKALAVFASAVSLKPNDATMNATLDLHGLDKLLAGYGITMKKDAVFDYGAQFRVPAMTAGGPVWIRHPGIVHVVADERFDDDKKLLDTAFPSFFRIEEMAFPFPSTLEISKEKQPDAKFTVLARTTENATATEGESVDMKIRRQWTPKPPYSQRIIAAAVDGKLKSAFEGDNQGIQANQVAPEPSRLMVISSSEFLTNPFAYAGNGPELGGQFAMFGNVGGDQELLMFATPYAQSYLTNTILSLKNTLDWISGDTDLLAASAKIIGFSNLTYSDIDPPKLTADATDDEIRKKDEEYRAQRKNQQFVVQWVLTLGLPLAVAAFGVLRWRSRQAKKDQYKLSAA